jgi:hypothetical protein
VLEVTAAEERGASPDERVDGILARMTLEEKAAFMFHTGALLYAFGHGRAY